MIAVAGIAVLAVAALGVVFVLPETVSRESEQAAKPAPAVSETAQPATAVDRQTDAATSVPSRRPAPTIAPEDPRRSQAQDLLTEALRKQAALESDGAGEWGAERLSTSYPDALAALTAANADFDAGNFTAAVDKFRQAISLLDQLAAGKAERYRKAMSAGHAALAGEDGTAAETSFGLALKLKPGDPEAAAGLRRAGNLPKVLSLMTEARELEASGNPDGALRAFRAAAELDPAYAAATTESERVAAIVRDRNYRKAVSAAFEAIDRRRFADADAALKTARAIRGNTPEIRELAIRLQQERQIAAIGNLTRRAKSSEREEDWASAERHYGDILKIDPGITAAIAGRDHAGRMVRLHAQMDVYLKDPDRLSSAGPLEHAGQVLRAAQAVDGAGAELQDRTARLADLLAEATKPRRVVLRSDGQTSVTVYRVARFGTLSERSIDLRPGVYTAVGSRPGYRDVRVEFRVPPGDTETVVVVSCSERI